MAQFTAFQNTLPDPNNAIGSAGQASGTNGPGFASISFSSESPIQVSRTNSGRVMTRSVAGHKWDISITYNPMTRDQFEPVYSFLLQQKGRLNPFYIQLPNQYTSRNANFNTHLGSNTIRVDGSLLAGVSVMKQDGHSTTMATEPQPGDMFTITDTTDSLHTKAYRVTKVLDNATYHSGLHSQPTTSQRIVYFTPNLHRSVSSGAGIDYSPNLRVMLKNDIQQYSLGTNNLYQFSLNLEEAQA